MKKSSLKYQMKKAVGHHLRQRAKAAMKAKAVVVEAGAETPLGPQGDETPLGPQGDETPLFEKGEGAPATPEPEVEAPQPEVEAPPPAPEVKVKIEPPEEVAEDMLWPQPGVRIAVGIENLMHALRHGDTGVAEGTAHDDPSQVIVRFDSSAVLAEMRIPRSILVPEKGKMSIMKMWGKMSEASKRDLLRSIGVRDPRDEVLPDTATWKLTMWGEYVPMGLRLSHEAKLRFVHPGFVKAFHDGAEVLENLLETAEGDEEPDNFLELEDLAHRQDVRHRLLQGWWAQSEVLLVCICDEASSSAALLAVRKAPISVRLYEVLGARACRGS